MDSKRHVLQHADPALETATECCFRCCSRNSMLLLVLQPQQYAASAVAASAGRHAGLTHQSGPAGALPSTNTRQPCRLLTKACAPCRLLAAGLFRSIPQPGRVRTSAVRVAPEANTRARPSSTARPSPSKVRGYTRALKPTLVCLVHMPGTPCSLRASPAYGTTCLLSSPYLPAPAIFRVVPSHLQRRVRVLSADGEPAGARVQGEHRPGEDAHLHGSTETRKRGSRGARKHLRRAPARPRRAPAGEALTWPGRPLRCRGGGYAAGSSGNTRSLCAP